MSGSTAALSFLLSTVFSLAVFALWSRIILRFFRISPLQTFAARIYSVTNFLLPLERQVYGRAVFPSYDWLCLLCISIIEALKFILLGLLIYKSFIPLGLLSTLVLADTIIQPLQLFFYAILARVLLSWCNPSWQQHPMAVLITKITNPLFALGYKLIPNISGFDFAPLILLVLLKTLTVFISATINSPLL